MTCTWSNFVLHCLSSLMLDNNNSVICANVNKFDESVFECALESMLDAKVCEENGAFEFADVAVFCCVFA